MPSSEAIASALEQGRSLARGAGPYRRVSSVVGRSRLGIEVLEGSGLDLATLDEGVDFVGFEADHAAKPVGGNVALVDEAVKRARRDAQSFGRFRRGEPVDVRRHRLNDIATFRVFPWRTRDVM